ncbi:MAG: hypothetical protein JST92_08955 [Deltaproteobacteria bacterium]|nr:hypothetical protein [Deltaproteobacteria bacterium]
MDRARPWSLVATLLCAGALSAATETPDAPEVGLAARGRLTLAQAAPPAPTKAAPPASTKAAPPAPTTAAAAATSAAATSTSAASSAASAPAAAPAGDAAKPADAKDKAEVIPPSTQEMYDSALEAHAAGDARKAAARLYAWLRGSARSNDAYEVAEHLLAEDLAKLGFIHGALSFETEVVRTRGRPELVSPALNNLEQWTRSVPHDERRLEEEVLHGADFGTLEGPAREWVAYHQGALDLRLGNDRWATLRFNELSEGSPWRARARVLEAATKLQARDANVGDALAEFEEVAADPKAPREARNDAHVEAARLRFEAGDYKEALAHYQAVDLAELDPGRGQLYLEEAYARVRLGDGSRAMGLLAALDAPSFKGLYLPEKYLLRASIFKDACQYLPAKRAARGLLRRYSKSLTAIRDRTPLQDDPLLADAALQKGAGERAAKWLRQLQKEREQLDRFLSAWNGSGLSARLTEVYGLAIDEATRRRRLELEKGVIHAADELLSAVEQVNLVDYEVGLALYRRAGRQGTVSPLTFANPLPEPDEVGFEFDGEYWNDELPYLRFALTDRCAEGVAP